jgi:glutamate synthase domain-containing protein 3
MSILQNNVTQTTRRPDIQWSGQTATIDAAGVYYRAMNEQVRAAIAQGAKRVVLRNVCGQRYIGGGLRQDVTIEIHGTPGNDLAVFMDGPTIIVHANGQDGVGNTMTQGQIILHGCAGDLLAHSLRGGRIFVRDGAGYRVGIHMKQYHEPVPAVVIGGCVGDYAAEYMAGGVLVVLGLSREEGRGLAGNYLGTGMHGGAIYLRGDIRDDQMGKEISRVPLDDADRTRLETLVGQYAAHFGMNASEILSAAFVKLAATSTRPYGRLYVY